jgi:hypothetical protein
MHCHSDGGVWVCEFDPAATADEPTEVQFFRLTLCHVHGPESTKEFTVNSSLRASGFMVQTQVWVPLLPGWQPLLSDRTWNQVCADD